MQIAIKIHIDRPVILPVAYHHIQQSIVYSFLKEEDEYSSLHEIGEVLGKRNYKLFTFGPFTGRYSYQNRTIAFQNEVNFEIRSIRENAINTIKQSIERKGITIGKNEYHSIETVISDRKIESSDIIIHMLSPICCYKTDRTTKHTRYYNPKEQDFIDAVTSNFERKYIAAYYENPGNKLSFTPIDVRPQDKYLTKYKGFIIEAYKGTYRLTGEPKYLDFLYQVGLGSKNSQGFGMFRVIQ